jgi:hypothetical protein
MTMTAADRLRWWLSVFETTQPEELDCDTVFEAIDVVVEAAVRGEAVQALFPAIALHLQHCPSCQDLYESLVALTAGPTG